MVAGDLALLFVCKLVCVCVHLALDVLRERIDVFRRPVGGSRWSILLFHLLLVEKRGERELIQTESSKGACQSHEMCVYVCMRCVYGTAVCFRSLPRLPWAPVILFRVLSSFILAYGGNEDQDSVVA